MSSWERSNRDQIRFTSEACVVHVRILCLHVKGSGEIKSYVTNQLHLEIVSPQMWVWSFSCGFLFSCANKLGRLVSIQFSTGYEVHPWVKGLILAQGEGVPLSKSKEFVLSIHLRSWGTWSGTRKKLRAWGVCERSRAESGRRRCEGGGRRSVGH